MWIHPAAGLLALIYLTEYVSRQAKMTRLVAIATVLPALTIYFAFRIPFFM